MLDLACIFTTGGVLLFYKTFCELGADSVNKFISETILRDKIFDTMIKIGKRIYKWSFDTELGIIFLFVYQEIFQDHNIKDLFKFVIKYYKKNVVPEIITNEDMIYFVPDFNKQFEKILISYKDKKKSKGQARKNQAGGKAQAKQIPVEDEDKEGEEAQVVVESEDVEENLTNSILKKESSGIESPKKVSFLEDGDGIEDGLEVKEEIKSGKKLSAKERMLQRLKRKRQSASNQEEEVETSLKKDNGKSSSPKKRQWGVNKITKKAMDDLDYSKKLGKSTSSGFQKVNSEYFESGDDLDIDFEWVSSDEETESKNTKKSSILSSFKTSLSGFMGSGNLTEEQLDPMLEKFKGDLMTKNVAEEIARNICGTLKTKLMNQKTQMFKSVSSIVKSSLNETLTNILTPKRKLDILAEAAKCREKGEPYILTFIGVNGVGKSTTLAKVAYLFKNQGFSVMMAACDSFRAGAVKQLQTHGNALNIPVFSKGYNDDPAKRAYACVREARAKGIDIVLIDTAGRMQDNEPLMKELARLVALNKPRLVIFIGEALVGNDGVDQLTKFNNALINYSRDLESPREIDAIIVSKFDTVDEKVGAAISMTYATGKPIIFLGTGQKYPNLRRMNADLVVKMLLS